METRTKIKLLFTALGVFLFGAACETASVTHQINECDGGTKIDVEPGRIQEIKAPGIDLKFIVNSDGTITYHSNPIFNDTPPFERTVGNTGDKHLKVRLLGDSDGNGSQDMEFISVCPALPTPTPTPRPTATPFSYLGKGSGRLASLSGGFHPDVRASKPVPVFRNRRG